MKSEELWPEQQIRAVELMSSILPNEFLFSICYLLGEWNQQVSLVKLCKMLNVADEQLIRDHLSLLLKSGFLNKTGKQYEISRLGKEGLRLLNEAVGNLQTSSWLAASGSDLFADATSLGVSVMPTIDAKDAQSTVSTGNVKASQDEGMTSETPVIVGGERLADAA